MTNLLPDQIENANGWIVVGLPIAFIALALFWITKFGVAKWVYTSTMSLVKRKAGKHDDHPPSHGAHTGGSHGGGDHHKKSWRDIVKDYLWMAVLVAGLIFLAFQIRKEGNEGNIDNLRRQGAGDHVAEWYANRQASGTTTSNGSSGQQCPTLPFNIQYMIAPPASKPVAMFQVPECHKVARICDREHDPECSQDASLDRFTLTCAPSPESTSERVHAEVCSVQSKDETPIQLEYQFEFDDSR